MMRPAVVLVAGAIAVPAAGSIADGAPVRVRAPVGRTTIGAASAVRVPAPTGRFHVGTAAMSLAEPERHVPFAPPGIGRVVRVQLWYPAVPGRERAAAYLPGAVAAAVAREARVPSSALRNVVTNARLRTRAAAGRFPVVLFSPGYSMPSGLYTGLVEELASQGFIAVSVDHTYETTVVQIPGGRTVAATLPRQAPSNARAVFQMIAARVGDIALVRRNLARIAARVGLSADLSRVGMFGHSLGGLTAAHAVSNQSGGAIACGADVDGSVYGLHRGLDRPFLILTHSTHDGSLARFWGALHAERRWFVLNGAEHLDFSDWTWLLRRVTPTPARSPIATSLGTINGARALSIERAYLVAFFGRCLLGEKTALLEAKRPPFPQVTVGRR